MPRTDLGHAQVSEAYGTVTLIISGHHYAMTNDESRALGGALIEAADKVAPPTKEEGTDEDETTDNNEGTGDGPQGA